MPWRRRCGGCSPTRRCAGRWHAVRASGSSATSPARRWRGGSQESTSGSSAMAARPEAVPEERRNSLLRRVDWRFLLRRPGPPRTLDLTSGRTSEAVGLALDATAQAGESMDLVVLEHPGAAALTAALTALGPGGEVVCVWRRPIPGGVGRLRQRLQRAG